MKIKQTKKCIICEKEFYYFEGGKKSRSPLNIRPPHAVTCSKKCSRIYVRIVNRLKSSKNIPVIVMEANNEA